MQNERNASNDPTESHHEGQQNNSAQPRANEADTQPIAETHEGSEATQTESERAEQRESEGKTTRQGNSSI